MNESHIRLTVCRSYRLLMAVIPKSSKHACRHPASRSASDIPHWVRSLTGRQTREATHSRTCWKDESTLVLLVLHQSVHALVVFFPCKISKAHHCSSFITHPRIGAVQTKLLRNRLRTKHSIHTYQLTYTTMLRSHRRLEPRLGLHR